MNIMINAEQAMLDANGKGRLEVITGLNEEQGVIQISFQDDGPGIAEQHLVKVFDPFFTTKPIGKGTGLGLSVSYGIVQEHGGRIKAANKRDGGAIFTVELPVTEGKTQKEKTKPYPYERTANTGRKRILVVDDEVSIVDLVRTALERENYIVDIAYDGDTALRMIKEEHFHGIISDLKMPKKGGDDVYLFCKEERPDLTKTFLILTGDVVSPDSLQFMDEYKIPYISKPFNLDEFVLSVNKLFGE